MMMLGTTVVVSKILLRPPRDRRNSIRVGMWIVTRNSLFELCRSRIVSRVDLESGEAKHLGQLPPGRDLPDRMRVQPFTTTATKFPNWLTITSAFHLPTRSSSIRGVPSVFRKYSLFTPLYRTRYSCMLSVSVRSFRTVAATYRSRRSRK